MSSDRPDPRLSRLAIIADLVHQDRLARLAKEAKAIESARAALRSLEPGPIDPSDPALIEAQLLHQKWAAACRQKLEIEVMRGQQAITGLRADAARSLARGAVIDQLLKRRRPGQPS